jgi:hypothetical protein
VDTSAAPVLFWHFALVLKHSLGKLNQLELFEKVILVGLVLLLSQTVELGEDAVQRDLQNFLSCKNSGSI